MSTALRAAGEPREKCDDRSKPDRSYQERECTLGSHPTTVVDLKKAVVEGDC